MNLVWREKGKNVPVRKTPALGIPLSDPKLDLANDLVRLAQIVEPIIVQSPHSNFATIREKFAYLLSEDPRFFRYLREFDQQNLLKLAHSYAECQMKFKDIKTHIRKGRYVDEVFDAKQIIAIGDTHGDVFSLVQNLLNAGALIDANSSISSSDPNCLTQKYVINPELIRGTQIVLMGDYLDRGDYSMELIDFIKYLRSVCKYSGITLHTLRGNHDVVFQKILRLFGGKPAFEIEKALSDPSARFDFRSELSEFSEIYFYFDIDLSNVSLNDISFNFSKLGSAATYRSLIKKYGSWENAVHKMQSDGTVNFFNSLKGAVIIDGNIFTHSGPPLFVRTIAELEEYYAFSFENPLSPWASIITSSALQTAYNPSVIIYNILTNNTNHLLASCFSPLQKAIARNLPDLTLSYISLWDGNTFDRLEGFLQYFGFNHIYVGHNGSDSIRVKGPITNIDAHLSHFYATYSRGGALILDPINPLLVKAVYSRDEITDKDGRLRLHQIPHTEEDLTEGRSVFEVFSSQLGERIERLFLQEQGE